jgi:hypothetical protein
MVETILAMAAAVVCGVVLLVGLASGEVPV